MWRCHLERSDSIYPDVVMESSMDPLPFKLTKWKRPTAELKRAIVDATTTSKRRIDVKEMGRPLDCQSTTRNSGTYVLPYIHMPCPYNTVVLYRHERCYGPGSLLRRFETAIVDCLFQDSTVTHPEYRAQLANSGHYTWSSWKRQDIVQRSTSLLEKIEACYSSW